MGAGCQSRALVTQTENPCSSFTARLVVAMVRAHGESHCTGGASALLVTTVLGIPALTASLAVASKTQLMMSRLLLITSGLAVLALWAGLVVVRTPWHARRF